MRGGGIGDRRGIRRRELTERGWLLSSAAAKVVPVNRMAKMVVLSFMLLFVDSGWMVVRCFAG